MRVLAILRQPNTQKQTIWHLLPEDTQQPKASNDLLIMLFNELMEKYPEYKEYIPKVTEQMIKKAINKLNMKVKSQVIVDFIMNRYQAIK